MSDALYYPTLLALVLAACATDAGTAGGLTRDGLPADAAPPDPPGEAYYVRAATVGAGDAPAGSAVLAATGTVVNERQARPSFKTGGLLTSVRVEAGDAVRRVSSAEGPAATAAAGALTAWPTAGANARRATRAR